MALRFGLRRSLIERLNNYLACQLASMGTEEGALLRFETLTSLSQRPGRGRPGRRVDMEDRDNGWFGWVASLPTSFKEGMNRILDRGSCAPPSIVIKREGL